MTRILVIGDVVWNTNLVRLASGGSPVAHQLPTTSVRRAFGGAPYLSQLIDLACADMDSGLTGTVDDTGLVPPGAASLPETVTIWSRYERAIGSRSWVWRVEQFLRAMPADGAPEDNLHPPARASLPRDSGDEKAVLVLDDENFGFRDQPAGWSDALQSIRQEDDIVLKTRFPLGIGPLWKELANRHLDQLTIIVPVSSLRARRAAITRGLSWDRVIEDIYEEVMDGASSQDIGLARRLIVPFSWDGAAVFRRDGAGVMRLERFVYHPEHLEGERRSRQPGMTLGGASMLTATVVRHLAGPDDYPLFGAIARALSLMGASHERGGGPAEDGQRMSDILLPFSDDLETQREMRAILHWPWGTHEPDREGGSAEAPEAAYRSAFHLSSPASSPPPTFACNLLQEVSGPGPGHYLATGILVVTMGPTRALDSAPRVRYADFLTVDRDEIERTNEIRHLFDAYRTSPDPKPLSIAVFGPPGSGKSFAIKQISKHLFGQERETLQWDLSQLVDRDDLLSAFDQIRDASVRGRLPLVFWDEFDTSELAWLKEFLMPMQEAQYCAGSMTHPFGKAIFVFAGGTSSTFQEFDRSRAGDVAFRHRKGPDFVSRLRGYLNIKGPNPQPASVPREVAPADFFGQPTHDDMAYVLRRAMLLRSVITRSYPNLVDPVTGVVAVSSGVIRGFLCAERFHHGARSIEAIVAMSQLQDASYFGITQLPSPNLLNLHVTGDFMDHVREGEAQQDAVDILAASPAWSALELGVVRDGEGHEHVSRVLVEELRQAGYSPRQIHRTDDADENMHAHPGSASERALRFLHEKWLRDHLLHGYEPADVIDHQRRLHPLMHHYDDLPEDVRRRSRAALDGIVETLRMHGYVMLPIDAGQPREANGLS